MIGVLDERALNRSVLARQLLLGRVALHPPTAVERIGCVQAQYAPSIYVGLWSRLQDLAREDVTGALESRSVLQGTLQRATIHLVSRADYWPIAVAVRDARRAWWLRAARRSLSEEELTAAAETLRAALADGPMTRQQVEALLGREATSAIHLWLDLVRVPPSGTWARRRADLYGLAATWVPGPEAAVESATEHLIRRYLTGFGPAPVADIAMWAGLPKRVVAAAVPRMELRHFAATDGSTLLDVPDGPLPDPDTPAPVRLLPTWDAPLLAHARRSGIVPEEFRPRLFHSKNPQSVPCFLVDGRVAGTWQYREGRVETQPFLRLGAGARRALAEEAEALTAFHA